jgi:hypothetical protein
VKTAIARADDDYNKADKVTGRAQTFREIEAVFYWIYESNVLLQVSQTDG